MNKRDMFIVALVTFCLTATLFMILPSRSTEKDPWADVNGPTPGVPDGVVNMRDIAYEVAHFNENVSDMTRNVNVTNWPQQDRVVWVGDWLATFNETNGYTGGYVRMGENPSHVGGYEKMTVIFDFPDQCANLDARMRYVQAELDWYLNPTGHWTETVDPSIPLYQIHGGATHGANAICVDSSPVEMPYLWVAGPLFSDYGGNGNVTISIYLYLSNGPVASSTRQTMHWTEHRVIDSGSQVNTGIVHLRGFTTLSITLFSNATWDGYIGMGDNVENFQLTAFTEFRKAYALGGNAWVVVLLNNPSTTPSEVSLEVSVIA